VSTLRAKPHRVWPGSRPRRTKPARRKSGCLTAIPVLLLAVALLLTL